MKGAEQNFPKMEHNTSCDVVMFGESFSCAESGKKKMCEARKPMFWGGASQPVIQQEVLGTLAAEWLMCHLRKATWI